MVHHSRIIGAGLRVLAAIASKSQTIFQSFTTQSFVCVLAITGLFLLLPVRSAAQVGSATLRGTVIDSTGAAVEGAQVSAELADSGSARTSVTMATGEYFFSALKPGVYTISVTKTGFSTFKQTNFTLELDQ